MTTLKEHGYSRVRFTFGSAGVFYVDPVTHMTVQVLAPTGDMTGDAWRHFSDWLFDAISAKQLDDIAKRCVLDDRQVRLPLNDDTLDEL